MHEKLIMFFLKLHIEINGNLVILFFSRKCFESSNSSASNLQHIALITAQKMKYSIKDFFSKCDQTRSFLRIWSHLLEKSLMENFIFCAVVKAIC